jgi:RNA polymerase sigma-70 factor (ECF subfamily)
MREALEARIRALCDGGDLAGAATAALEAYGPEVLGFVAATLRNQADASEVFSIFCEDMWKGLGGFGWRSSVRTWLFTLARHAAARYRRSPQGRLGRHVPLSAVGEVAERVRTTTLAHLRTEARSAVDELRASLDPDDRALLALRVSRQMSWDDIARVMAGDVALDAASLKGEATRLRKRFQRLKERLRAMALERGLIGGASEPDGGNAAT